MPGYLSLLLRNVQQGRSSSDLQSHGLMYFQIAKLMSRAADRGFLTVDSDGRVALTREGLRYLSNESSSREGSEGGWIDPMYEHRLPPGDSTAIYIPKKHVISKLKDR